MDLINIATQRREITVLILDVVNGGKVMYKPKYNKYIECIRPRAGRRSLQCLAPQGLNIFSYVESSRVSKNE